MNANSREEVFEVLRAKGIKAIKVVAADGSKANGAPPPRSFNRLVVVAAILAVALGFVLWWKARETKRGETPPATTAATAVSTTPPAASDAKSSPRHQIYGDPAVMAGFENGDFADALPREGDRLLAAFAQPGKLMCAKGANPRLLDGRMEAVFAAYAKDELAPAQDVVVADDDPREVRELKQIVNGMRVEMREYLANGNGTVQSYWRRLNERTTEEMRIYVRTRRELEKETSPEVWEQKNDALRRLGILTIPHTNEQ